MVKTLLNQLVANSNMLIIVLFVTIFQIVLPVSGNNNIFFGCVQFTNVLKTFES